MSIYGDSVLLGAREELLARFPEMNVSVDAVEDRSLLAAIEPLRTAGPALGDIVVLDLGYNDGDDPAVFRSRVDDAMTAMQGIRRVIWLNQHEWRPGRAGMNAELAAAAQRYPNLDVVDWNAEVQAHPETVYADQIHLTPSGQEAMATLVRQRVDGYVESTRPTTTVPATTTTDVTRVTPPSGGGRSTLRVDGAFTDWSEIATVAAVALGAAVVVLGGPIALRHRRRRRRRGSRWSGIPSS